MIFKKKVNAIYFNDAMTTSDHMKIYYLATMLEFMEIENDVLIINANNKSAIHHAIEFCELIGYDITDKEIISVKNYMLKVHELREKGEFINYQLAPMKIPIKSKELIDNLAKLNITPDWKHKDADILEKINPSCHMQLIIRLIIFESYRFEYDNLQTKEKEYLLTANLATAEHIKEILSNAYNYEIELEKRPDGTYAVINMNGQERMYNNRYIMTDELSISNLVRKWC